MRHPATILLFMVCVAAVSTGLAASGVTDWLGMQQETGIQDDVADSRKDLKDFQASRQGKDTSFIGATISATDETISSFIMIFALSDLLVNMGLPGWAAALIASPVVWSLGLFIIYMFSGRAGVRPR